MIRLVLLSAAQTATGHLADCDTTVPSWVEINQGKVAVPLPCHESDPERPNMPTEHLADDAGVDAYVHAAVEEFEHREGSEVRLG
ncbi:hypothetical protein [Comamonas testosteroni]|uniref:hypothetical protein n=1 Tax=Comamonas testosteroni TaxID=285 RepID=UPI00391C8CEC